MTAAQAWDELMDFGVRFYTALSGWFAMCKIDPNPPVKKEDVFKTKRWIEFCAERDELRAQKQAERDAKYKEGWPF